jgi:hypothetical protein
MFTSRIELCNSYNSIETSEVAYFGGMVHKMDVAAVQDLLISASKAQGIAYRV